MKIGRNSFGCPIVGIHTLATGYRCVAINEGGRWFSALWTLGRRLVVIFAGFGYLLGLHWHVDWGWLPKWGLRSAKQAGEFLNDLTGRKDIEDEKKDSLD